MAEEGSVLILNIVKRRMQSGFHGIVTTGHLFPKKHFPGGDGARGAWVIQIRFCDGRGAD
jgi:hypothetical protein